MKQFNNPLLPRPLMRKFGLYLAATATVAALAIATSGLLSRARADTGPGQNNGLYQVAQLDQLVANFHQAASYGGNLEAMMSLWADGSSLSFNGVPFNGKDGVRNYFGNVAGPFKHYWVSLAPEFKTQFDLNGITASVYLECHFADPSATPYVIKADIKVVGTVVNVNGTWLIQHLDFTTGATL